MTPSYRAGEREVLRAYAMQVLTDPASTDPDRSAAATRLLDEQTKPVDLQRLTTSELRAFLDAGETLQRLFAKARGEAYKPRIERPPLVVEVPRHELPPLPSLAADDEQRIRASMAAAPATAVPLPAPTSIASLPPVSLASLGLGNR